MSRLNHALAFVARAVIAGLALAFVVVYLWPALEERLRPAEPAPSQPPGLQSYADAVDRTAPAVVSVYTSTLEPIFGRNQADPDEPFRLYRLIARPSEGSGVILSEDGYILTNHHVVNQALRISVALWDDRTITARVIGSDPATDLAVLKVELDGLPVAPINPEAEPRVGDVVLAIGNSLGLSHTVSMGIVSAIGRNTLPSLLLQDFIQTDAAINIGNSGGALINTRGELIGINTSRADEARGAENIGFAIPIDLATRVMEQIIESGEVRRGWLGASYGNLQPTAQPDGSALREGIGVREVTRDGPAWNAGVRPGDLILSIDGEPVSDAARFLLAISERVPGSQVELEIQRGSETFQTYATLIQQPPR